MPIYEIVTVQVLLGKRNRFAELHRTVLLPTARKVGIDVVLCLMNEVGRVGHIVDVYRYPDYRTYDMQTENLERCLQAVGYYDQIQECIVGTISVELAKGLNEAAWGLDQETDA